MTRPSPNSFISDSLHPIENIDYACGTKAPLETCQDQITSRLDILDGPFLCTTFRGTKAVEKPRSKECIWTLGWSRSRPWRGAIGLRIAPGGEATTRSWSCLCE